MSKKISSTGNPALDLALDTIKIGKQALVFVNTKRSAEKTAEDISKKIKTNDKNLAEISEKLLKAISRPTRQCERLSSCVKKGIAFHHAGCHLRHGLVNRLEQRPPSHCKASRRVDSYNASQSNATPRLPGDSPCRAQDLFGRAGLGRPGPLGRLLLFGSLLLLAGGHASVGDLHQTKRGIPVRLKTVLLEETSNSFGPRQDVAVFVESTGLGFQTTVKTHRLSISSRSYHPSNLSG